MSRQMAREPEVDIDTIIEDAAPAAISAIVSSALLETILLFHPHLDDPIRQCWAEPLRRWLSSWRTSISRFGFPGL